MLRRLQLLHRLHRRSPDFDFRLILVTVEFLRLLILGHLLFFRFLSLEIFLMLVGTMSIFGRFLMEGLLLLIAILQKLHLQF